MKKIILLIALFSPLVLMAHEGHGISGSELLHLLVSHYYVAIAFAIVIAGAVYYRRRINSKE
jgi:hypothetical protein